MWNWRSPIRQNLVPTGQNISALWFGTGIHFALEDWHGDRRWGDSTTAAFNAYVDAFRQSELPEDFEELYVLGLNMLEYYMLNWEPHHFKNFRTASTHDIMEAQLKLGGDTFLDEQRVMSPHDRPLVEVNCVIPLQRIFFDDVDYSSQVHDRPVEYSMTFDRVVIDEYHRFWIVDYKTAARFDTGKLETDPQASAYTWGAQEYFGIPFEGVIWIQLLKVSPEGPRLLVNGEFSQAQNQRTTYRMYKQALERHFGGVPQRYVEHLNNLASQETEHGDKFIRYDKIRRNEHFVRMETWKIREELKDMLNPNLPLYPNPTRDCQWDCPFRSVCLSFDDGSDWEWLLENNYEKAQERDGWRSRVYWPNGIAITEG